MRILLVGNYLPDRQQSMLRFGATLHEQLRARGQDVHLLAPEPRWPRWLGGGRSKWAGYLDKYVLFPSRLSRWVRAHTAAASGRAVVHVVDHSNAVYVPRQPTVPWVATCHDLLAVRGALGEATDCPASPLGRRLQGAIVAGLARTSAIATVSTSTLQDVNRIVPAGGQRRRVILLGLNHPYQPVPPKDARARLAALPGVPWTEPFLLHVGSNLTRKNKAGVLRVFARLAAEWPGNLIFCGAELPSDLAAGAATAGLAGRVFAVPSLDNAQLEAAYSLAHALLFPSRFEGFGWPIIEAQACGCPVVCSDTTSLPEVAGDAALVHGLQDEAGMAESLRRLTEADFRASVVARGFANLSRFGAGRMLDEYLALYEEVSSRRPS